MPNQLMKERIEALEAVLLDLMAAYDFHVGPGPSAYGLCMQARENANLLMDFPRNSRRHEWLNKDILK